MNRVRGIRGATTAASNSEDAVVEAVSELLARLVDRNAVAVDDAAAADQDIAAHWTTLLEIAHRGGPGWRRDLAPASIN